MAAGGVCGALAAGVLDVSRWLPEAVAALGRACAAGPGAPAAGGAGAVWAPALVVAGLMGLAGLVGAVAGQARRGG